MMPTLFKLIFLPALFIILALNLSAQTTRTTFKGKITDEAGQPLPGITLMVLQTIDSLLIQFGTTGNDGFFVLKNIPVGEHLLSINFMGLQPVFKPVTSGTLDEMDLGTIRMAPASTILNEVQVTADFIPIEINKDTITYNADAFETQPNAVVEDLLKKLPGIEVANDGTIKAQGEDVQKVLVDGKEFFGTDPKMATKNLPAKAVKKVKVYDKKSDIAEFTGIDDGEREKTIDLQLREEFKHGLFGKAEAGYGSDHKYSTRASFNKFTKTSQLSFLGQLNNINEQGFSFTDQMNFAGGSRGGASFNMNVPYNDGPGTGLITTGAGGLNFNLHKNPKFNLRSSYFFNTVDNILLQDIFRQNLLDNPFDTEENIDRTTDNTSHNLTLFSEIKPDSSQEIAINGSLNLGNGASLSDNFAKNSRSGIVESESFTQFNKTSDNLSYRTAASYMRLLGHAGRNIATSFSLNKNSSDNESILDALTEFYTTGETELLDQLQYSVSENLEWNAQFSFTEPLKKRRFLELNYFYNETMTDYDKSVSDIVDSLPKVNPDLSSLYSSVFSYHRPAATFRYSGESQNLNVALQYQVSELTGHDSEETDKITKNYRHFLPRIVWRNDIGNGKHMRFNYTTRINPPLITQLSPAIDNSDPLRLSTGNPELNAEYVHSANLNFHSFTQFSSTSFFASIGTGLTKNKIITSRNIDAQLREISMPVNIDHESRFNIYASFGRPVKALRSRINLNASSTLTNTQNVIDNELLDLNRWSRNGGISFSNLNSKVLEYNFGGRWTFTDNYYKADDALNQNTLLHNYFLDMTLTVWKKWKLSGSYNYNLFTDDEFAEDQSLALMKASISRSIFPGDKGQIIFSVFDVLDENRGLSRTSEINYIQEVRSNSIGRYAMLTFVYNLRGAGEEPPGAIRMRPRH